MAKGIQGYGKIMDTVKFSKGNTRIIAHRGLSGLEVENTYSSFVAGANRSYYGIETDIHLSCDGHFVISHDDNFSRLAGDERKIADMTLDEIQKIVLTSKDADRDNCAIRPATLEDYLSVIRRYSKHAVIELKANFSLDDVSRIIEIVKSYASLDDVTFISFELENLIKVRELLPQQSVQYLIWHLTDEQIDMLATRKMDADVWCIELTKEQIDKAHARGIKVNCWTVNEACDGERLASWGIDFITTNILE